jgi:hypothetical protein
MKNLKWAAAVVALLLLSADVALACRCPKTAASADLSQFAAVFTGRVVESKRLPTGERVKFRVERVWKGRITSEVILLLRRASDPGVISSCDIGFQKGESYLVYALMSRDGGTLTTSKCTRTRKVAEAKEDFAALGEGQPPNMAGP